MDYAIAAQSAAKKIEAAGQLLDFFKSSDTPADVGLPWRGPNTDTMKKSVFAVILPPSTGLGAEVMDEELLKRMSFVLLVAPFEGAGEFEFTKIDDVIYKIAKIETLRPTNIPILHYIWLTR